MKLNKYFIIFIVVLLIIGTGALIRMPRQYAWDPTYSHTDHQPLGCALFDSILAASAPNGYRVIPADLDSIYHLPKQPPTTFLYIDQSVGEDQIETFSQLLNNGHNVVLVTGALHCNYCNLLEQIGISDINGFSGFLYSFRLSYPEAVKQPDKVVWYGYQRYGATPDTLYIHPAFTAYPNNGIIFSDDYSNFRTEVLAQVISGNNDTTCLAVKARLSGTSGQIIVYCQPLLFTNFAILQDAPRTLIMRLLSDFAGRPIARIDHNYIPNFTDAMAKRDTNELSYLHAHKPLRYALWLTFTTLLAGMAFGIRRRQRVIPIIEPPANQALAMTKHIGSLYFQRHQNADLLAKKFTFFAAQLRRYAMVDINDKDHLNNEINALSNLTGLPVDALTSDIRNIIDTVESGHEISDATLKTTINTMNRIIQKL